ncbi:DUF1214 domain-containing protein [Bdellovibrio sp. HCB185ZH]|uniref:DUF1214 domain-containing protein n=1 Tax=Bdellovibrio sp. HCB185ZH TaxID=3394235 RepID=UPI0039A7202A
MKHLYCCLIVSLAAITSYAGAAVNVTVDNFVRAETDTYMQGMVKDAGLGKLKHHRKMTPIEAQSVVRPNRDTLYSAGVFDLEAGPVTVSLPDLDNRYMSMADVSQDHYISKMVHAPAKYTYTKDKVGTRYMALLIRTLANPEDLQDMKAATEAQDKIVIEQAAPGSFVIPNYNVASLKKVRGLLKQLAATKAGDFRDAFGDKVEVNPTTHLLGAAAGWGGNPKEESMYIGVEPKDNSGKTAYRLTVGQVPVDAFWSISVYNAAGFFVKNSRNAYTINNLTAKKADDGTVTVQFGECQKDVVNCLPIMKGWNYMVRMYRPQDSILKGVWKFPEAEPLHQPKKLSQLD